MIILYTAIIFLLAVILSKLPFFIKASYWVSKDIIKLFTEPRKLHLYGIWLFCGLYGYGKTMGLTEYLVSMREKYGDKIYISTNYGYKGEDFPIKHWKDLLVEYDRPIIFGYDEIQNDFNSRDYAHFPYELVKVLTQNRKGHGKQIVGTAQRFTRVDKTIRELCTHVIECRPSFFGRVTKLRKYDVEDYEMYLNEIDVLKKHKIPCQRRRFIQTDSLRDAYDSFQMLESAKNKEYMSVAEKNGMLVAENLVSK